MSNDTNQVQISKLGVKLVEKYEDTNQIKEELRNRKKVKSDTADTDKSSGIQFINNSNNPYFNRILLDTGASNSNLYSLTNYSCFPFGSFPTFPVPAYNFMSLPVVPINEFPYLNPLHNKEKLSNQEIKKKKHSYKNKDKETDKLKHILSQYNTKTFIESLCSLNECSNFQKFFHKITNEHVTLILKLIGNKMSIIMTDTYANYFFQKLAAFISPHQRTEIIKIIKDDFTFIAKHFSGTHSLQALFDIIDSKAQIDLVQSYLENNIIDISKVSYSYLCA